MEYFKLIAEPGLVTTILATGVYLNRRKKRVRLEGENKLSYILNKYPFIMEVVYLLGTYWVYQVARAIGAAVLAPSGGELEKIARQHALDVINAEKYLGMFHELSLQAFFLDHPFLLSIINRVYSYIHIPGTCIFFVWFYYSQDMATYAPVRRSMSLTNMIAFTIFTLWPCAPPRFLPDVGFIDTVHVNGNASIWTTNRFCNQYAAMPSMHFGYSIFIGLNILRTGVTKQGFPLWKRLACIIFGVFYPTLLLITIVGTGNHFFLDAVVGGLAILLGFACNRVVLIFYPLQVALFNRLKIRQSHDKMKANYQKIPLAPLRKSLEIELNSIRVN